MLTRGGFRDVTSGSPLKSALSVSRWRPMWNTFRGLLSAPDEAASFLGVPGSQVHSWVHALRRSPSLAAESLARFRRTMGRDPEDLARVLGPVNELMYVIVRAVRPETIVETGVHYGFSSAFLLRGLADNGRGRLYSIDLPTTDPHGRLNADGRIDMATVRDVSETGCAVPDPLRQRWELILGPSERELPRLLASRPEIDVFFHDSDHSRTAMLGEYRTAWPRIRPGGLLLSDDIDWNDAFDTFRVETGSRAFRWFGPQGKRGALRKGSSASAAPS